MIRRLQKQSLLVWRLFFLMKKLLEMRLKTVSLPYFLQKGSLQSWPWSSFVAGDCRLPQQFDDRAVPHLKAFNERVDHSVLLRVMGLVRSACLE
mmetsp:Transcript_12624/g.20896  ORF Transcript_12624/g.20896 Transcript_12624/m.20896 type:complete len:94 (+) Transcript_12624:1416-1697(+)